MIVAPLTPVTETTAVTGPRGRRPRWCRTDHNWQKSLRYRHTETRPTAHYESDVLTVEWDDDLEAVVMNWRDFASGDAYREGLNAGLELVEETGATN